MKKSVLILFLTAVISANSVELQTHADVFKRRVEEYFENMVNDSVRLEITGFPEKLNLPDTFYVVSSGNEHAKKGQVNYLIICKGQKWERGVFIKVRKSELSIICKTKRTISKVELFTFDNLDTISVFTADNTVLDYSEKDKMKAKNTIPANTIVKKNQAEHAGQINVNDEIALHWNEGSIRLKANAKAIKRGSIGDEIKVRRGNKILNATVTAPNEAEVK